MPTSAEFTQAALKFIDAADLVGDLATEIDGLNAGDILRGGRLGREIPAGIVEASATAHTCQQLLESAATTCEQRSIVMAAYEIELEQFDRDVQKYNEAWADWNYKIGMGRDIAHPDVTYPTPLTEPTWPDSLQSLAGAQT